MDNDSEFQVFIEKSTIRCKKEAHGDTRWEACNRRPISETPFHAIEEVNLLACPPCGSQQEANPFLVSCLSPSSFPKAPRMQHPILAKTLSDVIQLRTNRTAVSPWPFN